MRTNHNRGRPEGKTYDHARTVRLMTADYRDVEALAEHWRCKVSEAIRRSIRETARREKVG